MFDQSDDFVLGAVASHRLLAEDQLTIDGDFKNAPAAWDKHDLLDRMRAACRRKEPIDEGLRQPDGPRCVVSSNTELDFETHIGIISRHSAI